MEALKQALGAAGDQEWWREQVSQVGPKERGDRGAGNRPEGS